MNYPYKQGYWETKDHRILKIEDMKTSHIENTIKYLKRNNNFYDETYFAGWTGDGQIYDYIDNSDLVYNKIEELEYELNKRLKESGE